MITNAMSKETEMATKSSANPDSMDTIIDTALSSQSAGETNTRDGAKETKNVVDEMMEWSDRERFACRLILVFNFLPIHVHLLVDDRCDIYYDYIESVLLYFSTHASITTILWTEPFYEPNCSNSHHHCDQLYATLR